MCFVSQWGALFRYLKCQKWSEAEVFCIFSFRHVLGATAACIFSTLQLPTVPRSWGVLVHFDLQMCFGPQRRATFRLSFGQLAGRLLASLLFNPRNHKSLKNTQCTSTIYCEANVAIHSFRRISKVNPKFRTHRLDCFLILWLDFLTNCQIGDSATVQHGTFGRMNANDLTFQTTSCAS